MVQWRDTATACALALLVGLAGCAANRSTATPAKDGASGAAADLPPRLQQGAGSESGPPYAAKEDKPLLSDAPVLSMEEQASGAQGGAVQGNAAQSNAGDAAGNRPGAGALTEEERRAISNGGKGANNSAGGSQAQGAVLIPPGASPAAIPGLLRVSFEFDKDDLTLSAKRILDRNADWMLAHAEERIRVEGHCDERGSNEYNLGLGQRRADRVITYLVTKGVRSTQMFAVSYGEEVPVAQGHNEASWSQNRRVDFSYLDENQTGQSTTIREGSVQR
jgi:peptidoglycan-associated lipoprotein